MIARAAQVCLPSAAAPQVDMLEQRGELRSGGQQKAGKRLDQSDDGRIECDRATKGNVKNRPSGQTTKNQDTGVNTDLSY